MRKRKSIRSDSSKKGRKLGRKMSDRREEDVRRLEMPWQIIGIVGDGGLVRISKSELLGVL
jgi:hypothetical protein